MSTTDDILSSIFRTVNPDDDDAAIAQKVNGLKSAGSNAVHQALSMFPGVEGAAAIPSAAVNDPTVQDIAANGISGVLPNTIPQTPIALGGMAAADGMEKPSTPPTPQTPQDVPSPTPVVPDAGVTPSPTPKGTPKQAPENPLASAPTGDDQAKRAALGKKNLLDLIPQALATGADAAGNAAAALGGKGANNAVAGVREQQKEQEEKAKTDLETKLKQDPNSDVSRHYQKVVSLMLGDKAKDFGVDKMSAEQIASTLPEVEKYMQKQLSMEAIKANKEVSMGVQGQNQQDKLEQEYRTSLQKELSNRSGGLGLQDQKVNSAIHARQLLEGARNPKTGEVDLNQVATPELAMTLANLVSGSNTTSLEQFKSMSPQSLHQYMKEKVGYLLGKPVDVLPKAWVDTLGHMVDRQGLTSEQIRDHYTNGLRAMRPTRLDPSRAEQLEKAELGSSYADTFGLQRLPAVTKGGSPVTSAPSSVTSTPRKTKSGTSYTVE